jgi:ERCC4-related helicase
MKYLKSYNESNQNIKDICEELGIKNYTINSEGLVDVNGYVNICSHTIGKSLLFSYLLY